MPDTLRDLVWRCDGSRDDIAARIGVGRRTLDRYLIANRAPAPVRRLLEVLAGAVPWPGGERLVVCRGVVYARDCRDGIALRELPGLAYQLKAAECAREERDQMRAELERYRAAPAQYFLDLTD